MDSARSTEATDPTMRQSRPSVRRRMEIGSDGAGKMVWGAWGTYLSRRYPMLLVYGGGSKQQLTRWNQRLSGARIKKGVQEKNSISGEQESSLRKSEVR